MRTRWLGGLLPILLALSVCATAQAQDYTYEIVNGESVTITGYTGTDTVITIPETIGDQPVTAIGNSAFRDEASLTSVTIPNSVTSIGNQAFYVCSSLTSVTIPNSVTSIGEFVFYSCRGLTSVTIPDSVISIGVTAFFRCGSLTAIEVDPANLNYGSVDGVLFDDAINTILKYPEGRTTVSYLIPSSVTSIERGAFQDCSSLTSVTIPNSVTSIGLGTFQDCSSLTSITIGNSVTSIGDYAFFDCSSLASVYFEGAPPMLGTGVFDGTQVTSYYLPLFTSWLSTYGGRSTAPYPFTLSSGVGGMTIESYTGTALILSIPEQLFGLPVTAIGNDVFADSVLTSLTLPDTVTSIGDGAFQRSASLSSINIPKSLVTLGSYAFFDCSAVTSVSLPNSLTSIGDAVFEGCNQLSNINIPTSLATLGAYAFSGCSSLSGLTFPSTLASIGDGTFESCTSLRSLYFEGAAPPLGGEDVFFGVTNLRVWYLPNSSGWTGSFGGFTPEVWGPQLGTIPRDPEDPQDALRFSITGPDGMACNVEACDDLTAAIWTKQATFTLTSGGASFSDPDWSTQITRFYRLRMPR